MDANENRPVILVMDDDEDVRFIAELMLKRIGFDVVFAENGHEAVEIFRKSMSEGICYHSVILDLNIPGGMGGQEAVTILKEINPDVAAYVSCGNPFDHAMTDPESFGFNGAIAKPFINDQLLSLLKK